MSSEPKYVLVPVKPDADMIAAGFIYVNRRLAEMGDAAEMIKLWQAMLAARPAAPAVVSVAWRDAIGDACSDCARPYGDRHGFPDLILPKEAWEQIAPTDGEGLLCPSCICARLDKAGVKCEGVFTSGPLSGEPRALFADTAANKLLARRIERHKAKQDAAKEPVRHEQ